MRDTLLAKGKSLAEKMFEETVDGGFVSPFALVWGERTGHGAIDMRELNDDNQRACLKDLTETFGLE
jgi:hypothetical protein